MAVANAREAPQGRHLARSDQPDTAGDYGAGIDEKPPMTIEIPPSGTRGSRLGGSRVFSLFNRLGVWMYRRRGSDPSGRAGLLLTTVGARSGQERTVPLGKFSDGEGRWLVVASLAGAARHPGWFINLARNPDKVWVEVGRDRFKVRPELLRGDERAEAWRRIVAASPGYGRYEQTTDREIPVVRLTPEQTVKAMGAAPSATRR